MKVPEDKKHLVPPTPRERFKQLDKQTRKKLKHLLKDVIWEQRAESYFDDDVNFTPCHGVKITQNEIDTFQLKGIEPGTVISCKIKKLKIGKLSIS